MKFLKRFDISEGNMDTSDFDFITKLSHSEINFFDYHYDDYENVTANVYWVLRFEWMGDSGLDYYIDVNKVEIEYTAVTFDEDEDIREEKTMVFDDPEKISVNKESNNQQIIVNEITIEDDLVNVVF